MSSEMGLGAGEHWLLLLSSLPSELSLNTWKVAFEPGLTAALHDASECTRRTHVQTRLDVGAAYDPSRGYDYPFVQKVFALFYELTCIICTRDEIDILFDNDVDVRFLLFEFQMSRPSPTQKPATNETKSPWLVDLSKLAQSRRQWRRILSIHSESGEEILRSFLDARSHSPISGSAEPALSRLPGGISVIAPRTKSHPPTSTGDRAIGLHHSVAVGGTFDHLHAGHKLLLTMSLLSCTDPAPQSQDKPSFLTIGITGDALLKNKKYKEYVEDWSQRANSVREFLRDLLLLSRPDFELADSSKRRPQATQVHGEEDNFSNVFFLNYVEIQDAFGPTMTDQAISALVISAETRSGAEAINRHRREKHWPELQIFEVGVLNATDAEVAADTETFEHKLSSTEIRSRIHQKTARDALAR